MSGFETIILERAEAVKKIKKNEDKKINLAAMKEKEVLAHYWESLYRETGGDAAQMSIISGKNKRTIYERIDKFIPKNNAKIRTNERKPALNLE